MKESKSAEESDISDSEIDEYREATYKMLKFRTFKIRAPGGKYRCPFCADKVVYHYTNLLVHAIRVGVVSGAADCVRQRANHSAVVTYLTTDLANEAELPPESSQPSQSGDNFTPSEDFVPCLISKDRKSNNQLQEARNAVIEGLKNMPSSSCAIIGVKKMGELDPEVITKACRKRYPKWQVRSKAAELCSSLQEKLKNSEWHPFRVVEFKGSTQRKVNEDDELLKDIKKEWGGEVHDGVVTALEELNEYNASGCYPVPELWNFKENCNVTLGEAITYVFSQFGTLKRKRV